MKTVTSKITDCSQGFSFIISIHALSRIFDYFQIVFPGNRHNLIHGTCHTGIMHRHDCLRLFRNRRFNLCLVNIHRIRPDIHKYTGSASEHKCVRCRHKGIGRQDYFITRLNVSQICCHLKGMSTGCGQQNLFGLKMLSHPCGTLFCKGTISTNHPILFNGFPYVFCFFSHKRRSVKTYLHSFPSISI